MTKEAKSGKASCGDDVGGGEPVGVAGFGVATRMVVCERKRSPIVPKHGVENLSHRNK
jgi:hypothetical protein